jgi:hypothetical protein
MISRSGKDNFFKSHYDWLAAAVGALALVGAAVFYVSALGENADDEAASEASRIDRMKPAETGVKALDMSALEAAVRVTKTPPGISAVSEKGASFLASERRVLCKKCKKAIPGNVKEYPVCVCGEKQEEEKVIVLDADADGMSDEWEKKVGLNPQSASDASLDGDGDGFPGDLPADIESDGNGNKPGKGPGAGGEYKPTNWILDGKTFYGHEYDAAFEDVLEVISQSAEMPDKLKQLISNYFETIKTTTGDDNSSGTGGTGD